MEGSEGDGESEDALRQRKPKEPCQSFFQDHGDIRIDVLHIGMITTGNLCGFKRHIIVVSINPCGPQ
jgi:hypothetical protein